MNIVDHAIQHFTQQPLPASNQAWLNSMRQTAFTRFTELGFPTARQEDWKYTRVTSITQQRYQNSTPANLTFAQIADHLIPGLDSYSVVFVNGYYQTSLSDLAGLPPGVTLCELTEALAIPSPTVELHLGKIADMNKHGFQALNTAYMQAGYCLHIPVGVKIQKPIQIVFLNTEQSISPAYQLRNLIVADAHSQAHVIEHYLGIADQNYWTNTITEVAVAEHAHLEHLKLQQESKAAFHVGTVSVRQASHSKFISHSFALGGRLVRSDTDIEQVEAHADCELNGLYLVNGKQHIDHHTSIDHKKAQGVSRERYKGIMTEQGRAVFNGKVVVRQDAQKINAAQTNKNLLLSDQAEIDTKPQLEIYADDVKCAHGATVGQLDSNQLFYLRSRGLDEQAARHLLIFAFAAELLEPIAEQTLRDYLHQRILQKLEQTEVLEWT